MIILSLLFKKLCYFLKIRHYFDNMKQNNTNIERLLKIVTSVIQMQKITKPPKLSHLKRLRQKYKFDNFLLNLIRYNEFMFTLM